MLFELALTLLPLALGAPVLTPRAGTVIPGSYIVKFKDSGFSTSALNSAIELLPNAPKHVYQIGTFKGFAAEIKDDVLKTISALPNVSSNLKCDSTC